MSFMTTKGRLELFRGGWSPVTASAAGKLRIVPVVSAVGAAAPVKTHLTMSAALAATTEYPSAAGWDPTPVNRPVVPLLVAGQDDTLDAGNVSATDTVSLGLLSDIDTAGSPFIGQRVRGCWVSYTVGASPDNAVDWPVYWVDGPDIEGENGESAEVTFEWPDYLGEIQDSGSVRMFNVAKKELLNGTWDPQTSSAAGRLRVMPLIATAGTSAPDLALATVAAVLATAFDEYDGSGWDSTPINRPQITALTASLDEMGNPTVTSVVGVTGEVPLGTLSAATKPIQGLLVTYSVTSTPNNSVDFPVWYWPGVGVTGANGRGNSMFVHWLQQVCTLSEAA
mgnify:CR=1 FL=1